MRKLFALLGLIAAFTVLPTTMTAAVAPQVPGGAVQRTPAWNPVGLYVINFGCASCVPHNITITTYNPYTGIFSGYGAYALNPAFTWTVSGSLVGTHVTMHILYTGQDAGYYINLTGAVAANGTMSGSATDASGDTFTWHTVSGTVTLYATHGQFVSAQDDKQMAAHSDLGMPVTQ
jgi:hypothetical protein